MLAELNDLSGIGNACIAGRIDLNDVRLQLLADDARERCLAGPRWPGKQKRMRHAACGGKGAAQMVDRAPIANNLIPLCGTILRDERAIAHGWRSTGISRQSMEPSSAIQACSKVDGPEA